MKATDILWDVDNEEELELLPKEVDIPVELTDEEEISDYLSELTGYCHCGFSLSTDSPPGKNKANDGEKESKASRFRSVAQTRVDKIIKMVRLLETAQPCSVCLYRRAGTADFHHTKG